MSAPRLAIILDRAIEQVSHYRSGHEVYPVLSIGTLVAL